jgi:EpsI family protein
LARMLRVAAIACAAMISASVGALALRPTANRSQASSFQLSYVVPEQFGRWRAVPGAVEVVNPQTQQMLDKLYSQMLARTYVNERGERIMLSVAYGNDQRGDLQAHMPEVCYPAQGFALVGAKQRTNVATPAGPLPVQRLHARLGQRSEPISYWFTFGSQALTTDAPWAKRMIELRFGLSGAVPDGILVRVSSIEGDAAAAFVLHDAFIRELVEALAPADRSKLVGAIG